MPGVGIADVGEEGTRVPAMSDTEDDGEEGEGERQPLSYFKLAMRGLIFGWKSGDGVRSRGNPGSDDCGLRWSTLSELLLEYGSIMRTLSCLPKCCSPCVVACPPPLCASPRLSSDMSKYSRSGSSSRLSELSSLTMGPGATCVLSLVEDVCPVVPI